jgi:hypothetical protein
LQKLTTTVGGTSSLATNHGFSIQQTMNNCGFHKEKGTNKGETHHFNAQGDDRHLLVALGFSRH